MMADSKKREELVTRIVNEELGACSVIYFFGSAGTAYEREDSDVDIAVLLPPVEAKALGNLAVSDCESALARALGRNVDLINLRLANTVFAHEIINRGHVIFCLNETTRQEFEMQTMRKYQKLGEERREIIDEILRSGSVMGV